MALSFQKFLRKKKAMKICITYMKINVLKYELYEKLMCDFLFAP